MDHTGIMQNIASLGAFQNTFELSFELIFKIIITKLSKYQVSIFKVFLNLNRGGGEITKNLTFLDNDTVPSGPSLRFASTPHPELTYPN